ncbi:MAG: ATP-binding protein, partial [Limisphaerales bacterium]
MLTSRYAMWMGWGKEFYFFCNDAYLPTVGIKRDWVLGTSARQVWAEIWPDVGPRAESVVQTGNATWDEALLLFLERSGYPEETYHTFSYSPVPDDDGVIGGMLCVVTEDTERVIAERRLTTLREIATQIDTARTEPELFASIKALLDKRPKDLPFGLIYLAESDGQVAGLVCSHPASPGTSIAPTLLKLGHPESPWPVDEAAAKAGPVVVRDLAKRFEGIVASGWDRPPKEAVIVPLMHQGQDRPAGFFIAGLNPYRPFDAAYRGFVDLLAGQISSALSNVRAYDQERKRAEALAELDRAKTAFFSNISHEFRTPLTLMLGPLEEEVRKGPNPKEGLELAYRASLRLLKLVNTLLDFSRIEAGRMDASFEPTDLASYTADLASVFRSAVERAGLRLVVDCSPLPEPVYVDREMWEKIVLNLLSNAFKFTFNGEIRVILAWEDRGVELRVSDSGVGIPEHELPKIFDRFHRVRGARSRTHEGTGIGLALVRELVEFHGGTISAQSTEDVGTTFTIRLRVGHAHLPSNRIGAPHRQDYRSAQANPFVEEALRWLPEETSSLEADTGEELAMTGSPGSG